MIVALLNEKSSRRVCVFRTPREKFGARILRNLASLTKVTQAIVASVVVYCDVFYNFSVVQVTSVWVALLEVFLALQFSHVARAL